MPLRQCQNRGTLNLPRAQQEVAEESKGVWQFIIEREIEAPDRFQAIQTYRHALGPTRK